MDRAYDDERTRVRAGGVGFNPVIPPKMKRIMAVEERLEMICLKERSNISGVFWDWAIE
jgi:hypothetical protein